MGPVASQGGVDRIYEALMFEKKSENLNAVYW